MDFIILALFITCLADNSDSGFVTFNGPKYARKNSVIQLNCSSSIPPKGLYVRFWMNGNIYLTVRKKDNTCFATSKRSECAGYGCDCSEDGRWYTVKFDTASGQLVLKMTCEMDFPSSGPELDIVQVTILDFEGPFISSKSNISIAGNKEELTCWITHPTKTYTSVKFRWRCPAYTPEIESQQNASLSFSRYTFKASTQFNGENCYCIVQINDYTEEIFHILQAQSSPILTMDDKMICNTSSYLNIICKIDGELTSYGFLEWIHTYDNKLIRRINGNTTLDGSSISISSCSYEHIGQYICSAWNKDKYSSYQANTSTYVYIEGVPSVERFYILDEAKIRFEFFSEPAPTNLEMYVNGKLYFNHTMFKRIIRRQEIEYVMFNSTVTLLGYVGNIEYNFIDGKDTTFTLVVNNDYGKTQKRIGPKRNQRTFDFKLQVIMWILITLSLLILTTSLSSMRVSCKNDKDYTTKLQIYHAAPSTADYRPGVYDMTEPHYHEIEIIQPTSPYLDVIDSLFQNADDISSDVNMAEYEDAV